MTTTTSILEHLNPEQREAVTTTTGPLLVIAGAGTGKTRVITHRIAYLIEEAGVPPWKIFASTFTNKAAEEMRRRIESLVPGYEAARITIGTFHSICVSILRREASHVGLEPRFTIADDTDQKALVKDILKTLDIPKALLTPQDALGHIGRAKVLMVSPAEAARDYLADWGEEAVRVYEEYEKRLAQSNAVDFDDLLLKVVELFQSKPEVLEQYQDRWEYFLIDEYQDINKVQYEFVRSLASREGNLCVVGDEDQSIYSWRGAEVDNILNFSSEFEGTEIIRLEQNYRSSETILRAANAVISNNSNRLGKNLWSGRGTGEPISLVVGENEREEAALVVDTIYRLKRAVGIPYSNVGIFYRVNALSRLYEDYLRERAIPYRVVGGVRFYDRMEIKDLLAYLRVIINPVDGISLMRIINKPRRGIGEKTLTQMTTGAAKNNVPLWAYLKEALADDKLAKKAKAGVTNLLTMIEGWRERLETDSPKQILDAVIHDTRFEESLGAEGALETLSRQENMRELTQALEDFCTENPDGTLDDYLERITLASAVDSMAEDDDCVSLMTLHSAKGLEFPVVFMTGLEDSIFPSPRSLSDGRSFEEERRLFYVGVTRAMDRLFLCRTDCRHFYGRTQFNPPSVFWHELPDDLTQTLASARKRMAEQVNTAERSAMSAASAEGASFSESAVETEVEEVATEGPNFQRGARIRHSTLGEGEVTGVRGEGAGRKVSIRFDAGLELEVLELYGGLERVEEDLPY